MSQKRFSKGLRLNYHSWIESLSHFEWLSEHFQLQYHLWPELRHPPKILLKKNIYMGNNNWKQNLFEKQNNNNNGKKRKNVFFLQKRQQIWTACFENPWDAFNLHLPKTRERHNGLKWDFVRIEGASGTPKKGFKIGKVKFHGVSLSTHTHCNFKLNFNHDRFIKNTHCDSYYPPNTCAKKSP